MRTLGGFCIACHTREATDSSFRDAGQRVEASSLSPLQKAEFLLATRQFDKAAEALDRVLATPPAATVAYLDLPRAIREMLFITVRVKQDPAATLRVLDTLARREDIPDDFHRYVSEWKNDVLRWQKEPPLKPTAKPAQLIARARSLTERAQRAQAFVVDPAGDIAYLRATAYLHEALEQKVSASSRGEALYLLALCYAGLQDPLLWSLDDLYFEACIRENPHSSIARQCYKRYSTKVYFGTATGGSSFLSEDDLRHLNTLRKLAE